MKRIFLLILAVESFFSSHVMACEGCKMASINGFKESQTIQAGVALSWSVLFLLVFVFFLLGILGWCIRNACREAELAHQSR